MSNNSPIFYRRLMRSGCKRPARQGQRGMTLIIGLILLVMLMMISVIGYRNTTLSERMTGNALDRNTSFQSAESAGKEGLQAIETGLATSVGYYDLTHLLTHGGDSSFWTPSATPAALTTPLTNCFTLAELAGTTSTPPAFNWASCAANVGTKYANNHDNAQYVIEFIATATSCATPVSTTINSYRVTSRSTGGSGQAEVVLQTIYNKTVIGAC